MAFSLDTVVPWGRSLREYRAMFELDEATVSGRILDLGAGPASFVAACGTTAGRAIAFDPLYAATADAIEARIASVRDLVVEQLRQNRNDYDWNANPDASTPEALGGYRMATMARFLDDYRRPDAGDRYVAGALPHLPFADDCFDLALCSHCLLMYDEALDYTLHRDAIVDTLRVASELRIFPTQALGGGESRWLAPLIAALPEWGIEAELRPVTYRFQRGAEAMLVCRRGHTRSRTA